MFLELALSIVITDPWDTYRPSANSDVVAEAFLVRPGESIDRALADLSAPLSEVLTEQDIDAEQRGIRIIGGKTSSGARVVIIAPDNATMARASNLCRITMRDITGTDHLISAYEWCRPRLFGDPQFRIIPGRRE